MNKTEQEQFDLLRKQLTEAQEVLEAMGKAPLQYTTIVDADKERFMLSSGGTVSSIERPKQGSYEVGDAVLTDPQSGMIVKKAKRLGTGEPVTVQEIYKDGSVAIQSGGNTIKVLAGQVKGLKEGDTVLLDPSRRVVQEKLAQEKPRFAVQQGTGVTWDDVGGQVEAKRAMREAIETPLLNPDIFRAYGKRPTKGILMSGPPGVGKTMLGKAAATAVAELTGAPSGYMYVKGPEILDPFVGVAEMAVRSLFLRAKEHKAAHGSPAVIFLDEADALLGRRGSLNSFMEKTIVPAFLTEMDGLEESAAMVILSTNRPDTLDAAIVRDGRMDRKIHLTRPNADDTRAIFSLYLKRVPVARGQSLDELTEAGTAAVFDTRRAIYEVTMEGAGQHHFTLGNLVSGALIAGIVDRATSSAMHRDIQARTRKASGISKDDLIAAAHRSFLENRNVDHADAVMDFANGRKVIHARKVHYAEAA